MAVSHTFSFVSDSIFHKHVPTDWDMCFFVYVYATLRNKFLAMTAAQEATYLLVRGCVGSLVCGCMHPASVT